jgi:hypothetical protein
METGKEKTITVETTIYRISPGANLHIIEK